MHIQIADLKSQEGRPVRIRGWLAGSRSGGKVIFLLLRDGTGVCQCVVEPTHPDAFANAERLTLESSLEIAGTVRLDERAPGQCEIAVTAVEPIQEAETYPISRKAHGVDFLLNHRHLWLRSQRQTQILRIRHTLIRAARNYFDDRGFTLIDTPILAPGAAEGAGTLFPVDFFGETVYLAQTGQLYLESAAMALGKVYCFGPTFRAEKSKTRRHLLEFWMIEPEIAFADLDTLIHHAESLVCAMIRAALQHHRQELIELGRDVSALENVAPPFHRMTYSAAVDLLRSEETQRRLAEEMTSDRGRLEDGVRNLRDLEVQRDQTKKQWKLEKLEQEIRELREQVRELAASLSNRPAHIDSARTFEWGRDFGGDEETILAGQFEKPLFITQYPREAKAFYMKTADDDPRTVLNLDLLAPEGYGEIIGGSIREDDLGRLSARMKEEQMDPEPYEWYLDLRRYGSVPHGGFGLGLERTVAWICGLKHVRETIPFPRLLGRIYP